MSTRPFRILTRWTIVLLAVCILLTGLPAQARAASSARDEYELAWRLMGDLQNDRSAMIVVPGGKLDYPLLYDLLNMVYPFQFVLSWTEFRTPAGVVQKISVELDPLETREWRETARTRAKQVVNQTVAPGMTDHQKALILHNWLIDNCDYDFDADGSSQLPFTAYAAMELGSAVCSGYTNAYTLLLREAGVPVVRINGDAPNFDGQGNDGAHTWNMVLVDGQWLFVDVTWDDSEEGPALDYFLLSYEIMARDHRTNIAPYYRFLQYVMPERVDLADALALRGLFRGMSGGSYNLGLSPDRAQGAVMMARLLGLDEDMPTSHPFTDVPDWADVHVSYLYDLGLTTGTSPTRFSPSSKITVNEYLTFVLRAMGYKDGVDFTWHQASKLGLKLGLVTSDQLAALAVRPFLRADMVNITYAALDAVCADGQTLNERLSVLASAA